MPTQSKGSYEQLPNGQWRKVVTQTVAGKRVKIASPPFATKAEAAAWKPK